MDWTEVAITVDAKDVDKAGDIAQMVVPYGIYIEDYSNLEQEAWEIAHIDLIDEELLKKDRTKGIAVSYTHLMGFGLGAALGAQVANPDRKVINIAGDGSFHMNCNELSTAVKYNIPIVELILDNTVLGMVRQWQKLFYDHRFSQTNLDKITNYEKLAEAFGLKAYTITKKEEIVPVLKEALSQKGPVLVHCYIDKDINVLPMVPAGASAEEPILEME